MPTPKELAKSKMVQERADVDQTLSAIQNAHTQVLKFQAKKSKARLIGDKVKAKHYTKSLKSQKKQIRILEQTLLVEVEQWAYAVRQFTLIKNKEKTYEPNERD